MTNIIPKSTSDIMFPNLPKGTIIRHKNKEPMVIAGGVKDSNMTQFATGGRPGDIVPEAEDSWECKLDMVTACSKTPDNVTVKISPLVKRKINLLMQKFTNLEWLAYLVGSNYVVEDLFIPNQTVTAASVNVDADTPQSDRPIIGVIHSHHTMGSFFSGTDDAYINMNHNISIVVSNKGMKAQARIKTPCGALRTIEAKVVTDLQVDLDEKVFEESVDEKVTTPFTGYKGTWYEHSWLTNQTV